MLWPGGKKSWVLLLAFHIWANLGVAGAKRMSALRSSCLKLKGAGAHAYAPDWPTGTPGWIQATLCPWSHSGFARRDCTVNPKVTSTQSEALFPHFLILLA